jgi:hypothetical protein
MTSEKEKGDHEIAIFREFIDKGSLPIDPLSVAKRRPPEPDILCLHADEGPLAFELVELCDSTLASAADKTARAGGFLVLCTEDPSRHIILKKLQRRYQTSHPIELLCYTNGRIITQDAVLVLTIRPMFCSDRSVFRRAWLLGENGVYLLWQAS